jgi:hypothetical protein
LAFSLSSDNSKIHSIRSLEPFNNLKNLLTKERTHFPKFDQLLTLDSNKFLSPELYSYYINIHAISKEKLNSILDTYRLGGVCSKIVIMAQQAFSKTFKEQVN